MGKSFYDYAIIQASWLSYYSSKLNLRVNELSEFKSSVNEVVVCLSFMIVWILDTVNMV